MPKLFIREGGKDSLYEIFDEEVSVGRGAANSVQVVDNHASKQHIVLRHLHGRWKLIDLESKNGTRVNGQFTNQHWLQHGDTVTIGSAVLRYDAEGVPAAAAPAAARPEARPAAAPARAAVPVRPAAPRAVPAAAVAPSRAAPPAPPAPAAAPRPPAPVRSGGGGPVSRRVRDDVDVDEETGRRYHRRGMSGPTMAMLIGGPVILGIILMFVMAGSGGLTTNQQVYKDASEAANRGDYKTALEHAKAYGKPGERDWERLEESIASWEKFLAEGPQREKEDRARKEITRIGYHVRTPTFNPKDAWPEAQAAATIKAFLAEFEGTLAASEVMNAESEPNASFRRLLQGTGGSGVSPDQLLEGIRKQAEVEVAVKKFGTAIKRYETLKSQQKLVLDVDAYSELRRKADARIAEITTEATKAFDLAMEEVKRLLAADDKPTAKARLRQIISDYGVESLVQRAKTMLDGM